jgi:hypothetical protein
LSDADRALLEARVRAGSTPQRMVLRALIVLMAADGTTNATIAEELGVCLDTARNGGSGSVPTVLRDSPMRPVRGGHRVLGRRGGPS